MSAERPQCLRAAGAQHIDRANLNMPNVPLHFDHLDSDDAGLTTTVRGDTTIVEWAGCGMSIRHPNTDSWPKLEDIAKRTSNLTVHGRSGFVLGNYGEFFLGDLPGFDEFRFGSVEVSFGQPTPLARYMFDRYHQHKYHGEWSDMTSCRIIGAHADDMELVLLNAFNKYEERQGVLPRPSDISDVEWGEGYDLEKEGEAVYPSSIQGDIEPLRCMYYAATNWEPAASCIQYYRVLEFYAFFSLSRALNRLRRDATVSDREFFLQSAQLLTKDERGPILRLVSELLDQEHIDFDVSENLIPRPEGALLASTLYEFRNSIVHAKQDARAPVTVDSVIATSGTTVAWRSILQQLARKAIHAHSSVRHLD